MSRCVVRTIHDAHDFYTDAHLGVDFVLVLVLSESSSWTLVGMLAAASLPDEVLACSWLWS